MFGAVTGLILGLWSFDGPIPVPEFLGNYLDTSRRLARLGHIAFFGLGILNILLAQEIARTGLERKSMLWASRTMNFGNIFLPLTLFASSYFYPLKYFLSIPALSVTISLMLTAYSVFQRDYGIQNDD